MRIALILVFEEYSEQAIELVESALESVLLSSVSICMKKIFPRRKKVAIFIECKNECSSILNKIRKKIVELDADGKIKVRWLIIQPIIEEIVDPTNIGRTKILCKTLEKIGEFSKYTHSQPVYQIGYGGKRKDAIPWRYKLCEVLGTYIIPKVKEKIFRVEKNIESLGIFEYEYLRLLLILEPYIDKKVHVNRIMESENWLFGSEIDDVKSRLMKLQELNIISILEDGQVVIGMPVIQKIRGLVRSLEEVFVEVLRAIRKNIGTIMKSFGDMEETLNNTAVVLECGDIIRLCDYIKRQKYACDDKDIKNICINILCFFYPEKMIGEKEIEYILSKMSREIDS